MRRIENLANKIDDDLRDLIQHLADVKERKFMC